MERARSVKHVLKVVDNEFINLYRGPEGYWYFTFDDGDKRYLDRSVWTPRLSDLSLESWVSEARQLIEEVEKTFG